MPVRDVHGSLSAPKKKYPVGLNITVNVPHKVVLQIDSRSIYLWLSISKNATLRILLKTKEESGYIQRTYWVATEKSVMRLMLKTSNRAIGLGGWGRWYVAVLTAESWDTKWRSLSLGSKVESLNVKCCPVLFVLYMTSLTGRGQLNCLKISLLQYEICHFVDKRLKNMKPISFSLPIPATLHYRSLIQKVERLIATFQRKNLDYA